MSFQDIGRKPTGRPSAGSSATNARITSPPNDDGASTASRDSYAAVSQLILQYQQNVGILSNIVENLGSEEDGPLLQKQFKVQIDVIHQLGNKIETKLQQQEQSLQSMSRTEASKNRATHIKLTRDYHWMETKFKNLQLEARQIRSKIEARRRAQVQDRERREFVEGIDADNQRLQMQLQDDRVTEEIMREREEEVRKINQGMHQVNEIYKDLANIVSYQQDQVDEVEAHMEKANKNAESGLKQIEKARAKQDQACVIS